MAGFIASQRAEHGIPLAVSCRALGVSQSWLYKWLDADPSPRKARRDRLAERIKQLFDRHKGRYGAPRIAADLREEGWTVSENTVAALLRAQNLRARRRRRRRSSTRPGRARWRAPDRVGRDFGATAVNTKWYGDGTEIETDEGKLHLVSVLDAASRRVLGFTLAERHDAEQAYEALTIAVATRGGQVPGVLLHTDQGSEYTAGLFRDACQRMGIHQSMGRAGSALDNAVIEAWHSTVEFELRRVEHFTTKAEARAKVAAWIDDYNRARRHSALGMRSPIDWEASARTNREGAA